MKKRIEKNMFIYNSSRQNNLKELSFIKIAAFKNSTLFIGEENMSYLKTVTNDEFIAIFIFRVLSKDGTHYLAIFFKLLAHFRIQHFKFVVDFCF